MRRIARRVWDGKPTLRHLECRRRPCRLGPFLPSLPAGRGSGMGNRITDAADERLDRCCGHPVQDRLIKLGSERTQRWPVGSIQPQQAGLLPGGGQRDISIQGGKQYAARPGGLPPQRQHHAAAARHRVPVMHPDQPGHASAVAQRADPGQASDPVAIGMARGIHQRPATSHSHHPGPGSVKTDIQQHLAGDEHQASQPTR